MFHQEASVETIKAKQKFLKRIKTKISTKTKIHLEKKLRLF